jgi:predicted nuclease of predicted toxin-antitoxin system
VIVLDENIFASQRSLLRKWRIHLCQIGRDIGRKGMQDDEIISLLRKLRRPSLVSRDSDFFKKSLCHDCFCLLYLDVPPLFDVTSLWCGFVFYKARA